MKNDRFETARAAWLTAALVALVLAMLPLAALAETRLPWEIEQVVQNSDGISNDSAVTGYINRAMYFDTGYTKLRAAAKVGERLTGPEGKLYSALKKKIVEVAAGKLASTVFTIPLREIYDKEYYSVESLGVANMIENGQLNFEGQWIAYGKLNPDVNKVIDALLLDCPYELYWYDKTYGTRYNGPTLENAGSNVRIKDYAKGTLYYKFAVASEYSKSGKKGTYTVDTSKGAAVQAAAANAKRIVEANAGKSDLQKLCAYKDEICNLVDYNYAAVNHDTDYGNPWQLVWIFDGNTGTKVVCEGYSKGFQYLCDMSTFSSGKVGASIVTGTMMNERGGGGLHMWNLVTLEDGCNYMADVTNCDEGSVGYPDKLFLKGYTYKDTRYGQAIYFYEIGDRTINYTYDSDVIGLYSAEELEISENLLGPDDGTFVRGDIGSDLRWAMNGDGVLYITGTGSIPDYTENSPAPWDAGKVTKVTIGKGVGDIGSRAFYGCAGLTRMEINEGPTSIGGAAFIGCHSLTQVTIPTGLTSIADDAFDVDDLRGAGKKGLVIQDCANSAVRKWAEDKQVNHTVNHGLNAVDPEVPATCVKTGLTRGTHCERCKEVFIEQTVIPIDPDNHAKTLTVLPAVAATCTMPGRTEGSKCPDCLVVVKAQQTVSQLGHVEVKDAAVAATCEGAGLTEGSHCSRCNALLKKQETVKALGHVEVTDAGVAATCTSAGLTEGSHCSRCNAVLKKQETVNALGHSPVTDAGVAATCTSAGLTEGSHCSRCNAVLKKQETVKALGHSPVADAGVAATCTNVGLTEGSHCSRCNAVLKRQETIPALGHVEVRDAAVAATCEGAGLTEGSHCSRCNAALRRQEAIPALGHSPVTDAGFAATCTSAGLTEGSHCSRCNATLRRQEAIPALGHSPVTDAGFAATCSHAGLTEGSHCSRCGEVLRRQETLGRDLSNHEGPYETLPGRAATCVSAGLAEGKRCAACGQTVVAQAELPVNPDNHLSAPVELAGFEPTCTQGGLARGSRCPDCGRTLVEQQPLPARGHSPVDDPAVPPGYGSTGLTHGSHCQVCGTVLKAQEIVPALTPEPTVEPTPTPEPTPAPEAKNTFRMKKNASTKLELKQKLQIVVDGNQIKSCKSSKTKVAKVTNKGLVTARAVGTATVTITLKSGKKLTLKLTVVDPKAVTSIRIGQGKKANLKIGKELTLKTTLKPSTASKKLTYKSNIPTVASVSGKGVVKAKKAGKATITVTAESGVKATIVINVVKK